MMSSKINRGNRDYSAGRCNSYIIMHTDGANPMQTNLKTHDLKDQKIAEIVWKRALYERICVNGKAVRLKQGVYGPIRIGVAEPRMYRLIRISAVIHLYIYMTNYLYSVQRQSTESTPLHLNKMPDKVALVIGASRGIGRQVAVDLAKNGYAGMSRVLCTPTEQSRKELITRAVVVSAKTTSNAAETHPFPPPPNSPKSTISTVAREIREAGGEAAAIPVDVRDVSQIENLVGETIRVYGRLDVLVYNSGAIWWSSVENTPTKRFQLMQRINPEGLYAAVQAALPVFGSNGWKGRVVVVSPPVYSRFFRGKTAYAMGALACCVELG